MPTEESISPTAPPGTPRPPSGVGDIFDNLLSFSGSSREYAAMLLASAFSTGMLRQGAVFNWDRESKSPLFESAIPPFPPEDVPAWLKALFDSLPALSGDSRTQILPRPASGNGKMLPGGIGIKPLVPGEPVYLAFEMMKEVRQEDYQAFIMNLEMLGALWRSYLKRISGGHSGDVEILAPAISIVSSVNKYRKFQQFSMTLCNDLASRFGCDRVSLGILKGRYVRMAAMSHTEKFGKGMELVQSIEAAMEECLDQDAEIIYPGVPGSVFISRASSELSRRFDSGCIISVPIRDLDKPMAVLTLERIAQEPPDPRDVKLLRLTADMIAPMLFTMQKQSRWPGARLAAWTREKIGVVLGHKHTWAKLAALACLAAILFFSFARGMYRIEATFVSKPLSQRVLAVPYDGYLAEVYVRPGEKIEAGATLMAELQTAEIKSRLAMKKAEATSHLKDAGVARRENKFAEAQAAEARAEQADAEADLLQENLVQSKIYSPVSGVVLSGDWVTRVGAPVKLGDTLFEVAPMANMEADLYVPEEEISDVLLGQTGELAAAGSPDEKIRFKVVRITPLAELVKQKNVFRVQVELFGAPQWMLPGLEGIAKIDVEERPLLSIWSRRAVNWVKMKFWLWF